MLVALVPLTICSCEKNVDFVDVCETQGISMVLCFLSMQSTTCFLFFVDGVLFRTMAPSSSMFFLNFSVRFFEVSRGPFRNLFLVGRPTARCPEVGLDFWFLRCPEVELEIWFLMSRSWIGHLAARCPEVGLEFCVFTIFVFPTKFERLYEEVEGSLTVRVG